MTKTQANQPLTDQELVELDDFLLSTDEQSGALSVDEAHGYISALVVSDAQIEHQEWLSAVLAEADFANDAERDRIEDLLLRMYDEIATGLEAGRRFEPLVIEEEENGEILEIPEGWCYGFMLGVAEEQDRWEDLPREQQELLAPIAKLALTYSEDEDTDLDEEDYESLVDLIPGSVNSLYDYWH
ncbi:MAG: YecA family protein [Gammaproteobacteria bacterium]|nr:YecA family protein [Gammaproteobacteria bacterium]